MAHKGAGIRASNEADLTLGKQQSNLVRERIKAVAATKNQQVFKHSLQEPKKQPQLKLHSL